VRVGKGREGEGSGNTIGEGMNGIWQFFFNICRHLLINGVIMDIVQSTRCIIVL